MDEFLEHYGTPRHSGRYPWGSGKDPYQRSTALKKYVDQLRSEGISEKDIAAGLGFKSVKQLRASITIANSEIKKQQYFEAIKLKEKGYSNQAIGEALKPPMGESSVRNLLKPHSQQQAEILENVSGMLKSGLEKGRYMDIGEGSEVHYGVSQTKLYAAVEKLKQEGYLVYEYDQTQQGTGMKTHMKLLVPPGTTYQEMYQNRDKLGLPEEWSPDDGYSVMKLQDPVRVKRDRILVRYAEEGGDDWDGTVLLRRGVEDISLGDTNYAQVRIAVEGDRYMKGMAFYVDDIPEGYDIIYNTNKPKGSPDEKVFKGIKDDPDNPFGASIKQYTYQDAKGQEHLSAINKVGSGDKANEEGKWDNWARKLPSQFLAKQPIPFAKKQLGILYDGKVDELEEIKALTNPVLKRQLLMEFADSCDSAAVSMHAAALPRQATKVIFPAPELKDDEIYAPTFNDGEEVVLVRFPHAGPFESPRLIVNNKNKTVKNRYKQLTDAVAINKHVADQLSGADYDGDTVLVLPTATQKIKTDKYLSGLKEFDHKALYARDTEEGKITVAMKNNQMGRVSNLITDMTIRNAPLDEIERAVKHSMVIIDSGTHNLDWKKSEIDNGIPELIKRYQIKPNGSTGGASTLLSAGTGEERVPTYRERVDYATGKKIRIPKENDTYVNAKGQVVQRTVKRPRIELTDDAMTLSSGTKIELTYAEHVNKLKRLGEEARREAGATKNIPLSPSAKKTYAPEVQSLNTKLNNVLKNKPLERAAQAIAGKVVADKKKADPSLKDDKDKLSKIRNQELARARARTGAKRTVVDITPREWEAIQAGALSSTSLAKILSRADKDQIRQYATPKDRTVLTSNMVAKINDRINRGMTIAEVANQLGISTSTVSRVLVD